MTNIFSSLLEIWLSNYEQTLSNLGESEVNNQSMEDLIELLEDSDGLYRQSLTDNETYGSLQLRQEVSKFYDRNGTKESPKSCVALLPACSIGTDFHQNLPLLNLLEASVMGFRQSDRNQSEEISRLYDGLHPPEYILATARTT